MDSITIAMASAISIDLGTLLAAFLYKLYLLARLLGIRACTSCIDYQCIIVAAAIRDKHSLHSTGRSRLDNEEPLANIITIIYLY